jgi:hypothetical protein
MYTKYGIKYEVILNSSLSSPPKSGSIIRYSSLQGKASHPPRRRLAFCISRSAESLLSKADGNVKSKNAKRSELFLVKPSFASILTERIERQDIRVPATKKKSAITKVMALFLFYLIFITFGAASRSAFRYEVSALFFESQNEL